MPIIFDHVTYTYAPETAYKKVALNDVSFEVKEGEFLAVVGHTGSGKSTMVQHMNGLEKATEGHVYFHGQDIYDKDFDMKELRTRVGMVFQYPEHQLFETTVLADVCFGPLNQGLEKKEATARAYEALLMTGMKEEQFLLSPFELSGGQKRRVAIAGVLAMKPEVIILDEPTAGLDPKGRDDILDMLKEMHEKTGNTVVLVSHSMEDVATYADRMIVMNKGQVFCQGTPKEVFAHADELSKIGLGAPSVSLLMDDLKASGMNVETGAITVEEAKDAILKMLNKNV
ncbi:MAG: energy-coupling factor transporter ATPase [Lachnospiraceae bacterium]|nr:energy-coupling factor transporter ATPase [Lachnospiraceae bacterium]